MVNMTDIFIAMAVYVAIWTAIFGWKAVKEN